MSKIICEVCGTAYPETSGQCPICGCVRPADVRRANADNRQGRSSGEYSYVKGGRFSEKNVRKRSQATQAETPAKNKYSKQAPQPVKKGKKKNNNDSYNNRGLVITIVILLLAIVAVIGYIVVKFFLPTWLPSKDSSNKEPAVVQDQRTVSCQSIQLESDSIILTQESDSAIIKAELLPVDTTDSVFFSSDNEDVAIVSDSGKVTAVSSGEATITVRCGSAEATCIVTCQLDTTEPETTEDLSTIRLNRENIVFTEAGENWLVYSGGVPVEEINWSSSDTFVASVSNGTITAVSNGTAIIYAEYNGITLQCNVSCNFIISDGEDGNGNVSEDGDTTSDSGNYKLYNVYNPQNAKDVTLSKNDSFLLQLVDEEGNAVSGVTWKVDGTSCTVTEGVVTAVRSGNSTIIAEYKGVEYSCLVRVS